MPTTTHPYTVLDVFTSAPLAGNALAVVHDADGVGDDVMLAFARETRLAETSFLQTATAPGAAYRNRIWTIAMEMPFAGHPSLGAAVAVAARRGEREVELVQQTHAGLQPIDVRLDGDVGRASMLQEPPAFGAEPDVDAVLAAVGLTPRDAHPSLRPQVVSTGFPTLVAPVADRAAVARAVPRRSAIRELVDGPFNLYICGWDGDARQVTARCLPSFEMESEDPATGSAAGPLVAYVHDRLGVAGVEIAQGEAVGRPSRLLAEIAGDRVRVSGDAVIVATGTVRLPETIGAG